MPMKSPKKKTKIKETCPSFRRGHLASDEDVKRLRTLTLPHVDSFNYFLDEGLIRGIRDIEPAELDILDMKKLREGATIDLHEVSTVKFWLEDVKIAKPTKAAGGRSSKLIPRECRERKIVYAGQMFGKFCYRIIQRRNGTEILGPATKIAKIFGNIPIMVLSNACHLNGLMPRELVKHREEVSISAFEL